MRDRIAAAVAGVAIFAWFNRAFFCKRGWHILRTQGNTRGFYFYCPLCDFFISGEPDHDDPES